MRRAALLIVLAALAAAAAGAHSAQADGDPASDYLFTAQVFLPYDAKIPAAEQQKLTGLVAEANRSGFPIRVAVIWSNYDLGSITSLWRKPRTYARFLGAELTYGYKQRLLIVMPNGFGFNWPKHETAAEYAALGKIPIASTPTGLVQAAQAAVQRLAAARGVKLAPAQSAPTNSNAHDRTIIIAAVLGALALAAVLRLALRRRGTRSV
jgi:hypothetical protein